MPRVCLKEQTQGKIRRYLFRSTHPMWDTADENIVYQPDESISRNGGIVNKDSRFYTAWRACNGY